MPTHRAFRISRAARVVIAAGTMATLSMGSPAGAQPASSTTRADLAWRYLLMDGAYSAADSMGPLADSTRAGPYTHLTPPTNREV